MIGRTRFVKIYSDHLFDQEGNAVDHVEVSAFRIIAGPLTIQLSLDAKPVGTKLILQVDKNSGSFSRKEPLFRIEL